MPLSFLSSLLRILRCTVPGRSPLPKEPCPIVTPVDSSHSHRRTDASRSAAPTVSMGAEWSARTQRTINEIEKELNKAESEATISSSGIKLFKFECKDSSLSNWEWTFVSGQAWPRFYNEHEDLPSKGVLWRLEIEAGEIDTDVGHQVEMLGDRKQHRVTFRAGPVWAMIFPDTAAYNTFWNEYNSKLYHNIFGEVNTQESRETHFGRDFASRMFTEQAEDMEWEEVKEPKPDQDSPSKSSRVAVAQDDTFSLIRPGIGECSYLVHGHRLDAMRNVPGGMESRDVSFNVRKADGTFVAPSVVMLAERERRLGMLSPDDPNALLYADIETGQVVQEWKFEKNDVEIPMMEIIPETKNAPAEDRSSFLSLDTNRLCRWDTRDPSGIVQQYLPKLDLLGGKDYARNTNFTCFATTGDGSVAVGSNDGKVRLYSNTFAWKKASTAFPGIGTPITHIDVTNDGKWIVATTDHFIEVLKTTATDDKGRSIDGFYKSLGMHAAGPKLLKLRPEDGIMTKHAPLKKARFTFVTEANHQERFIVATCGNYSVLWNFRQVKANTSGQRGHGGLPTFMSYRLVSKDDKVVDSCFIHDKYEAPVGFPSEAAMVVATSKAVSMDHFYKPS